MLTSPILADFLTQNIPASWLSTLTKHSTTYYYLYKLALTARNIFLSLLSPLITRLTTSPDIASVTLLLLLFFVAYQFLNLARRALFFWVRQSVRMAFWGAVASVGMWVWTRGPAGAVEDLANWSTVWRAEYEKWNAQAKVAQGSGKGKSGWR